MKKLSYGLILISLFLGSCASKKDVLYFQNAKVNVPKDVEIPQIKIQVNDILSVKIGAENPEVAAPYNLNLSSGSVNNNIEVLKLQGYLVSNEGTIFLPVIGSVDVLGKTIPEAKDYIAGILKEQGRLDNPDVNIRIINSKVSVMGEVKAPGTYTYAEQQITLLQALGYAGDLTINGNRDDVMLIREEGGERTIVHIDLTKTDWFDSPYFFMKQNDVIYVGPNNAKVKSSGVIGNASTLLTAASVILSAIVLITK
ncbi:sugar transporter [Neptunitalea chrysea]|uniref:Sugar transporter n=1 Tax=Neptunitalea chrysea TaxID=1647581 RepID=A0A9W6EUD0_9FLAO|nr:polysaccharide biosynthesis/export family protein [Neptunitalea chrysea]GLB51561.1 sugar transporter [Neptunitalea chrysea]